MIKKTLYFGNPAYLSLNLSQLVIHLPGGKGINSIESKDKVKDITKPIEDIGVIVLDNSQITLTQGLINALLDNNCAIISCDNRHMPSGLMLPICGNSIQSERFNDQINASLPLKKQLWQQTIKAKIQNQTAVLSENTNVEVRCMKRWANDVKSGDSENLEGRAAAYYWKTLFSELTDFKDFTRSRDMMPPNNLLNYGYAILRAVIARALVSSGMLPTLGIHHHNKYNAYCLADDIMEPYRPYVDNLVFNIIKERTLDDISILSKEIKSELLSIPAIEVIINGKRSPLMVAASQTTASLYRCFAGEIRNIAYPAMQS